MRKLLAALVFSPALALAAEHSGSEKFYQAEAGHNDFTGGVSYQTLDTKVATSKAKTMLNTLSAEYERGLTEALSAGAELSYSTGEKDNSVGSDNDYAGLNNWLLFLKGNAPLGAGTFRYKAELSLSLEDSIVEKNGDTNMYTGGHSFIPTIGYEIAAGPGIVGGFIETDLELGKRKTENKSTAQKLKASGGETTVIGAFYEMPLPSEQMIGGSIAYSTVSDIDYDNNTSSESISPNLALTVYSKHHVGAGELLPSVEYQTTLDDKVNNVKIDDVTRLTLGAKYRILF